MTTIKHIAFALALCLFALFVSAQAQTPRVNTVNITPDADRVHINATGDVTEMRIEVSDEAGDVVFQSGAITGHTLDWKMTDAQGERVSPGTYLVTVTFRHAAGKLRKRVEQVTVAEDEKADAKMAPAAPQAVQADVTTTAPTSTGKIPKFASPSTVTNSIITESASKIGVGIAPTASHTGKLVVAGQIQTLGAGSGIKFADSSVQTKAGISTVTHNTTLSGAGTTTTPLTVANLGVGTAQLDNGAVTAGKIGAGQVVKSLNTLSDDVTLTAGDNVTITSAGNTLRIDSTDSGLSSVTHDATLSGAGTAGSPLGVAVPLTLSGAGAFNSASAAKFSLFNTAANTGFAQHVTNTGAWQLATTDGVTRMLIEPLGNIGVGTANPQHKLHVLGGGGNGVYGETNGGLNGVLGVSNGSNGVGVRGDAYSVADAIGVHGYSQFGWGVFGYSNPSSGVRGLSSQGNGVEGYSTSGNGVYGENHSGTSKAAVHGKSFATGGNGVIGEANTGSNAFGVWGKSTEGHAGYFSGKVTVTGTLSKSSGSFKIDHPLDPANKYLYHSFVESPDMMNIYNGNVVTNASGIATITLPAYFQALNRDFRYQLTVIGGEFAQAIISSKIKGNRFTIKTDKPNVEVSWQVTGIRKDAWAEAHRIPIEEDKPERERGSYLHPELFNQPEERGVEWALRPEFMQQSKEKGASPPPPSPSDK